MDYIEIKHDKTKLVFVILTSIIFLIGGVYMLYFTEIYAEHLVLKIIVTGIAFLIIFFTYTQIKALFNNHSVITLTKLYIEINADGNPETFSWTEIKELTIERKLVGKGYTYYLIIKLDTITKEIIISDLDKNINSIRELIKTYKPKNSTATIKMDND